MSAPYPLTGRAKPRVQANDKPRRMVLNHPGKCRLCRTRLYAGQTAYWSPSTGAECLDPLGCDERRRAQAQEPSR